jgi:hypothetical protein
VAPRGVHKLSRVQNPLHLQEDQISAPHGASVLSSDVNRPSRRLHTQRPPHAPLVTNLTTEHPALITHEVPAGSRQRTAIPARPGARPPARAGNPRLSPPRAEATRPACHAGGRGFESRRSRRNPCKLESFGVGFGANDRRLLFIPRRSRGRIAPKSPQGAGGRRQSPEEDDRPSRPEVFPRSSGEGTSLQPLRPRMRQLAEHRARACSPFGAQVARMSRE